MEPSEHALERRARRAYELGRLREALPFTLLAVPPTLLTAWVCERAAGTALHGAMLALLLLAYAWRGQDFGRAILPGILVGYAAFLVPWLAVSSGVCPLGPSPYLLAACAAAGLLGGLGITWRCLANRCCSPRELLAVGGLASLTASLGCAVAGLLGLLGMGLGLALAAAPGFWVLRRA